MDQIPDERKHTFEDLCSIVSPVAAKYGVEKVYLFGSRARGDNRDDSDYDFYIEPGRIRTLTKLGCLLQDLEDALRGRANIVTKGSQISDAFSREMFRDRRLVYES